VSELSELLPAVLIYLIFAVALVWCLMKCAHVRLWWAVRRTRRTTRKIWARHPSARPRERPTAPHIAATRPRIEERQSMPVSPERRQAT
jgi:hypothetical protein